MTCNLLFFGVAVTSKKWWVFKLAAMPCNRRNSSENWLRSASTTVKNIENT